MGCRELEIEDYFHFVGTNPMPKKSHSSELTCTPKNAYSRFSHTVISNYRYYSAELGRWMKRDPIKEEGSINLYELIENEVINKWDKLGLVKVSDYKNGKLPAGGKKLGLTAAWFFPMVIGKPSASSYCSCDFTVKETILKIGKYFVPDSDFKGEGADIVKKSNLCS